jgi:hypothetical protein
MVDHAWRRQSTLIVALHLAIVVPGRYGRGGETEDFLLREFNGLGASF